MELVQWQEGHRIFIVVEVLNALRTAQLGTAADKDYLVLQQAEASVRRIATMPIPAGEDAELAPVSYALSIQGLPWEYQVGSCNAIHGSLTMRNHRVDCKEVHAVFSNSHALHHQEPSSHRHV